MATRLLLFGPPALETDGGPPVALPFERRHQLLAHLALRGGWVPRRELATLLWPEQREALAAANLRKTLFRLQDLAWAQGLESQGGALRLVLDTDLAGFAAALRDGRLDAAIALRRGEPLAGYDDADNEAWTQWLLSERDRLRAAWRAAVLDRIARLGADEAAALSARLLELDPYDEAALRAQVEALHRLKLPVRAGAVWRDFVERLGRELGVEPGHELRAWHAALSGVPAAAHSPPAPARSAAGGTADGFVGRAAELRELATLLARRDVRLLTLVGPGGAGKTRLAQRLLAEQAAAWPDGGLLVTLEDLDTAAGIAGRIARAAGLASDGRDDALPAVLEALRARHMLLVLDNLEHLDGAAAVVQRLLDAVPGLQVLATSRVRLALPDEQLYALQGLPYPEPEDADRVEAFDAARLFVRAARRVDPTLAPAAEAEAIVSICRQVEGLPLALELAAAWTRVMSCEAIAEELRRGTELLATADPARPARQASLAAVFGQSWSQLGAAERHALARLSVFRGGFGAEAARRVAGASSPVLAALADRSLLRKEGARHQLHPLVLQFAAERLDDGDERAAARAAHAAYFGHWLAQAAEASEEGDAAVLAALDLEAENLRAAWGTAVERGDLELLLRAAPALVNHAEHRAGFADALALLQQALAAAAGDGAAVAVLRSHAAALEFRLGRYAEAERGAAQALDGLREGGDPGVRHRALRVQACCAYFTGRMAEAQPRFEQAVAQARAAGLPRAVARGLENLSLVHKGLGHYDESLVQALDALAQYRRLGDRAAEALCRSNLASLAMHLDDREAAALHLREALALSERHRLVSTRAYVLANLTDLALRDGDPGSAARHAAEALEVARQGGLRSLAGWLLVQQARLAIGRRELPLARVRLAEGAAIALELQAPNVTAAVLLGLAELLEAQGEAGVALRLLDHAATHEALRVPDRAELRAERERRGAGGAASPAIDLGLDELLRRVVTEGEVAHAPLVRALSRPG